MSNRVIHRIEGLAALAWAADFIMDLDGWRLRRSVNSSRRTNSVWPNAAGTRPLDEKLVRVEEFYAAAGRPARYQMCPAAWPTDLDAILERRGYRVECPTFVQTTPLETILRHAGEYPAATDELIIADALDAAWLDAFADAEGFVQHEVAARREVMLRIVGRTGFALAQREGRPVAVGLGVLADGWVGLFNMATCPAWRRRGVATTVLAGLARWGLAQGARDAYLQVTQENAPALGLYARLGFATLYRYHYRTLPTTEIEEGKKP